MNKYSGDSIKDLFNNLGVEYLSSYLYEVKGVLEKNNSNSDYFLDNKTEFEGLTKEYGDAIRDRLMANIYIGQSSGKGYGLFTKSDLQAGDFVGVYIGVVAELTEMVHYDEDGFDTDYAWDYPDEIPGLPPMEINAKFKGNEMRFANHSEEPNLRVEHTLVDNEWFIFFVADCDIKSDEELTISYGDEYWDSEYRQML